MKNNTKSASDNTASTRGFHVNLTKEDLSSKIILVENTDQLSLVSSLFSTIRYKDESEDFLIHTGNYKGTDLSVISMGKCARNIDILINEIDALFNYSLSPDNQGELTQLSFVKLNETIAMQADIQPGSYILTKKAGGLDGLIYYYRNSYDYLDESIEEAFVSHTNWSGKRPHPYFVISDEFLHNLFNSEKILTGISLSIPGFYGPKGVKLRLPVSDPLMFDKIQSFRYKEMKILNYDTGSSSFYGLCRLLNHRALSLSLVNNNRISGEFLSNKANYFAELISFTLESLVFSEKE